MRFLTVFSETPADKYFAAVAVCAVALLTLAIPRWSMW